MIYCNSEVADCLRQGQIRQPAYRVSRQIQTRQTATELGVLVELETVKDMRQIAAIGVMSTPAVAIDGKVIHSGRVPLKEQITGWLTPKTR